MHRYEVLFRQAKNWEYAGHTDGPVHIERDQALGIDDIVKLNGAILIVDVVARGAGGAYVCVTSVESGE